MQENKMFKSGNYLQFEFKGKTVKAEVVRVRGVWVELFGEHVGSSWFRAFKKDWLLENAVLVRGSYEYE